MFGTGGNEGVGRRRLARGRGRPAAGPADSRQEETQTHRRPGFRMLPARLGFCTGVRTWRELKGKPQGWQDWGGRGRNAGEGQGSREAMFRPCSITEDSHEFLGWLQAPPVGWPSSQATPSNVIDVGPSGLPGASSAEIGRSPCQPFRRNPQRSRTLPSLGTSFCLVCFSFVLFSSLLFVSPCIYKQWKYIIFSTSYKSPSN